MFVKLNGKWDMFYLGNEVGKYGFGIAELEGSFIMKWEKLEKIFDPSEHKLFMKDILAIYSRVLSFNF